VWEVNVVEYYALMNENGKWDLLKLFQQWGGRCKRDVWRGGSTVTYCKHFCKCHSVPPGQPWPMCMKSQQRQSTLNTWLSLCRFSVCLFWGRGSFQVLTHVRQGLHHWAHPKAWKEGVFCDNLDNSTRPWHHTSQPVCPFISLGQTVLLQCPSTMSRNFNPGLLCFVPVLFSPPRDWN
jgi:hypothetical protein